VNTSYLLMIIVALQLADIVTTVLCLNTGKAHEANPILSKLFDAIGVIPALVLIKGAFIATLIWAAPHVDPALLWLCVAAYAWVIFNNLRVLQK
jgi:Domain of unknown function (DUF5658)